MTAIISSNIVIKIITKKLNRKRQKKKMEINLMKSNQKKNINSERYQKDYSEFTLFSEYFCLLRRISADQRDSFCIT